jgi:predicted TIM-barrel fold metal-dependent hydrolase
MAVTTTETERSQRKTRRAIYDADIHVDVARPEDLDEFMPAEWVEHRATYGGRYHYGLDYPRFHARAARHDAWPPSGLPPGADLDFLREQLLDGWNVESAVMAPLLGGGQQLNTRYGAVFAAAINDWQIARWCEPEPRLKASVTVPWEDAEASVAEIERVGDDRRFVQIHLLARAIEPLGRRRYWPIYRAAAERGLPVAIHLGGWGGGPLTGAGSPSFYIEERTGMITGFQDQVTSLVFEGVLEEIPDLKIVLAEGSWGWLLPLMWRLDRAWELHRSEVPHVAKPPSQTIRERFWITTQPVEEPPREDQLVEFFDRLDMDGHILFATDYPHWDFDAPDQVLSRRLGEERLDRIMGENARALFRS